MLLVRSFYCVVFQLRFSVNLSEIDLWYNCSYSFYNSSFIVLDIGFKGFSVIIVPKVFIIYKAFLRIYIYKYLSF